MGSRICKELGLRDNNLTWRKILCNVGCDYCEKGEELIDHVLLQYCLYVEEVWSFTGLRNTLPQCSNLSSVDLVDQMVTRLKDPEISIFFSTSWMIWLECNKAPQGTSQPDTTSLARTVAAHAIDYLEANFASLT